MKMFFLFSLLMSFSVWGKITHVRVLFHQDPSHEATLAFTQEGRKLDAKVFVSEKSGTCSLNINQGRELTLERLYHREKKNWLQVINLTNLKPNTKYYFCIRAGDEKSSEYNFVTIPSDSSSPIFLLFGGDSRSDREDRIKINQSIQRQFESNPNIYALVHGGDMVWSGKDYDEFSEWMQDHQLTTTSSGRLLPLIVTQGNHEDGAQLFNDIFVLDDSLANVYYKAKIGSAVIYNLNTNLSAGGDQLKWLEDDLKKSSSDSKWIFANYHIPAYPAVKRPGNAKKFWVPVFEKYQFDLVFESDGHVLKKTVPIFKDRLDMEKGIIYVGEGGLGVKLRTPETDRWYLQSPGFADSIYHYFQMEIRESAIKVDIIREDNSSYDSFILKPRKRPL